MIRTLMTLAAVIIVAVSLAGCTSTGRAYTVIENGAEVRKIYKSPHHNPAATQGSLSESPFKIR